MSNTRAPEHRRWQWKLGRIAGIDIYLHATFFLLLAWIALSHLFAGHSVAVAAGGLLLIASVLAVVVLHELGHALVARRFGIATRDITLYPIGGVARLERMPERPLHELLVAIAGPAVNLLLAGAIYLGLRVAEANTGGDLLGVDGSFAVQLMLINLSLGLFNLLPAFPMDGGRILRAVLAFRMDRARATAVAARIGRGLAVVMGIAGLMWNPMLAVIAVFVWVAAGQEATLEQLKTSLRGLSVADVMIAEFHTLAPDTTVGEAAAYLQAGFQQDFPVEAGGRVVGMLTRADILRGRASRAPSSPVGALMHREVATVADRDDLEGVIARLPPDGSSLLVMHGDRAVGLLDSDHVGALMALGRPHPAA